VVAMYKLWEKRKEGGSVGTGAGVSVLVLLLGGLLLASRGLASPDGRSGGTVWVIYSAGQLTATPSSRMWGIWHSEKILKTVCRDIMLSYSDSRSSITARYSGWQRPAAPTRARGLGS